MKNLAQMMKQAQEMQAKMTQMQEQLGAMEVAGSSGGGMVKVTMSGKGEARSVKLDAALMNASEREVLEDLLVAAFNDAKAKAESLMAGKMQELTGGLQLPPGFKLPF